METGLTIRIQVDANAVMATSRMEMKPFVLLATTVARPARVRLITALAALLILIVH
jgi:hypothetical protein